MLLMLADRLTRSKVVGLISFKATFHLIPNLSALNIVSFTKFCSITNHRLVLYWLRYDEITKGPVFFLKYGIYKILGSRLNLKKNLRRHFAHTSRNFIHGWKVRNSASISASIRLFYMNKHIGNLKQTIIDDVVAHLKPQKLTVSSDL